MHFDLSLYKFPIITIHRGM